MFNRRFVLLGASALLAGCAARAASVAPAPSGGPLASASPSAAWNGNPLSGYASGTAPVTPTEMTGATSNRPMPTAHWFTVPLQSFCDDFVVHVVAKAPNGIASVEFFHENPTSTVVNTTQRSTVVNGTVATTLQYETFAIKLPASAWCNDAIKGGGSNQGASLYAKITAKPVGGITLFPRIIGPLRICPRFPINGLPHDKVILITPDGKDDSGATVVAPSNGQVVNTLAQAENLIGNGGAYASAFNPLVKFMKSGTYDVVNQRDWGSLPQTTYSWWTLTHAPGVVATLHRSTAPSYDRRMTNDTTNGDVTRWNWVTARGLVELRGSGLILDHTNFAGIQTDTSPDRWDNHCKHTLGSGVAPVADAVSAQAGLGVTSKMYNFYWNGGPHPSSFGTANNADMAAGTICTGSSYEYIGANGGSALNNMMLESTFYQTPGTTMGANQRFLVGTYSRGQVTGLLNPGTPNVFIMQCDLAGATYDFSANTNSTRATDDPVLILHDSVNGTTTLKCGFGPSDARHTVAQMVAAINALPHWTASVGPGATVYGWASRWCAPETAASGVDAHTNPVVHVAKQPTHTEYFHIIGFYTVAGAPRIDNILLMNNVLRNPVHWGSATFQTEGTGSSAINRMDNSWLVNNYLEDDHNGDMSAMTGGSFTTVANNTHDVYEAFDPNLQGENATIWSGNISKSCVNALSSTTTTMKGNLTQVGADISNIDASNHAMTSAEKAALFVNQGIGDIRAGGLSIISGHLSISPEPYDLLGNLRDPTGDYPGALSKNSQASAPVWPF